MKKIEAQMMAPEKSDLIIKHIIEILSSEGKVNAYMDFDSAKIDNQNVCVLHIYVPENNFEKHLNLEIGSDHYNVLYEQLLNDLLDTFLEHETIGVTKYFSIKSMQTNFTGIHAVNLSGGKIKINFNGSGTDFNNLISNYTQRYHEFEELIKNQSSQDSKLK